MNTTLKQDICSICDPSLSNSELADLPARLKKAAPKELRYACVYWTTHLASVTSTDEAIAMELENFCTVHLLHWLELCSLLKCLPSAEEGLNRLMVWFEVSLSSQAK